MKTYSIVLVSRSCYLHNKSGGMETHLKNLSEGLAKKGHKITVITTMLDEDNLSKTNAHDLKINYIFMQGTTPGSYQGNYFTLSREVIENAVNDMKADVVIGESAGAMSYAMISRNNRVPVIEIAHGTIRAEVLTLLENAKSVKDYLRFTFKIIPFSIKGFLLDRRLARVDDAQICVSEQVASEVINDLGISKDKVSVVHNGADPNIFERDNKSRHEIREKFGLTKDDLVMLSLGRIIPEKGFQDIIRSISRLDEKWKALIIGDGDYLAELKKLAQELGVQDRIKFNSAWVPYSETPKYYSAADLFVLPTRRREGFPMSTIEAQLCGLPVIVADKGGSREAVAVGDTGYVYESGNLNELVEIINNISDRKLLDNMSDNALTYARENFTVERMVDKTLEVINKVCNDFTSQPPTRKFPTVRPWEL